MPNCSGCAALSSPSWMNFGRRPSPRCSRFHAAVDSNHATRFRDECSIIFACGWISWQFLRPSIPSTLILSDAKAMSDEITALGREIDQIAAAVSRAAQSDSTSTANVAADPSSIAPLQQAWRQACRRNCLSLLAKSIGNLQAEYINAHGGLLAMVMQGGRPRAQLSAKLHELSRQVVQHVLAGVNVLDDSTGNASSKQLADLRSGLALATPSLMEFGGTRRVLAILPRDSSIADVCGDAFAGDRYRGGIDPRRRQQPDALRRGRSAVDSAHRGQLRAATARPSGLRRARALSNRYYVDAARDDVRRRRPPWSGTGTRGREPHQTISRQDMCKTLVM